MHSLKQKLNSIQFELYFRLKNLIKIDLNITYWCTYIDYLFNILKVLDYQEQLFQGLLKNCLFISSLSLSFLLHALPLLTHNFKRENEREGTEKLPKNPLFMVKYANGVNI